MKANPTLRAILLVVSLCLLGAVQAHPVEMVEMGRHSLVDAAKPLSAEAVRHAIVDGAAIEDWRPAADQPGIVTLARNSGAGQHLAVVDVLYDTQGWQIVYRSSDNMNYERTDQGVVIRSLYNKWIEKLDIDIRHALAAAQAAPR